MILYCRETPGLKLGPGTSIPQATDEIDPGREVIVFRDGFVTFDEAKFPLWRKWVDAPGTPHIEILGDNPEELTPEGTSNFLCDLHEEGARYFKTQFALNGHLRSHAKGH